MFSQWLNVFLSFAKHSQEGKVLLIAYGHSSRTHLNVLCFAKGSGNIMLLLRPQCTNRFQHFDVPFYGPMKTYYCQEIS
jgi:hypothetical protein